MSTGVAVGALAVELTVHFKGNGASERRDFPPAFLAVAAISALSVFIFARLSPDAGAEMANRLPTPTEAVGPTGRLSFIKILTLTIFLDINYIRTDKPLVARVFSAGEHG